MFCLPKQVTANIARSEWSRYRSTVSQTSETFPASFGVPSTLYTLTGWLNFLVVRFFVFTKFPSTKRPVAPQSRRASDATTSPVSSVCIETSSSSEFEFGVDDMTYRSGSRLSHFGRFRNLERGFGGSTRFRGVGMAFESFVTGLVEGLVFDSYTSSTNNLSKRFFEDNGGIPLTRCPRQNPLRSRRSLPLLRSLVAPLLSHPRLRMHPVRSSVVLRSP